MVRFRERRNEGLIKHVQAIPGATEAVTVLHQRFEGRIACASGADRFKVELQLDKCGLLPYFKGRIFSGHELPRSKPAVGYGNGSLIQMFMPMSRSVITNTGVW